MTLRSTRSLLVAAMVLGLAAGCSDPANKSIRIVSPLNGAALTADDDVTDTLAGVQIDVRVEPTGFANGDLVTLVVNDNVADGMDRSYAGGEVTFTPVSLDPGTNVIEVSGGGVQASVTVTLEGDVCPRLQFVRPTASARIETRDDADGDPANGFQYDVQLTTTAADGTGVDLFVGGTSAATVDATAGRADFSAVRLLAAYPEPGAAANVTLRAEVSEACSATITVQVVRSVVCSSFTFVEPADGAVFGVADDENGDPSDGFQQTIVASTDAAAGTEVELLIDGSTVGSTTVAGTVVRFESVDIPEGTHVLRVQTSADCGEEISVTVDTGAPTCDITAPTGGFLNAADDVDAATAGLQVDFDVASDGGDGQPVRLILDGDEGGARSVNLSGGHAAFAAVGLSEGDHTARARCQNSVGNVGFSATFTYTVDSVIPTCSITAPADGTWFNTGDDALSAIDGTQVQAMVHAAGDPTATTVSRCGYAPLDPEGVVTLDGSGNGSGYVTLAGPGNEVCCGVQDEAGNAGEGRITLNLETDAPQFEIRRPDATTTLILAVDDEGPSDTFCQYTVTVGCSNVGRAVTLTVNTIAQPDATCTASADALGGTATWTSTSLPQGTVVLSAGGTSVGGLSGTSPDKTVTVDTEPPVLVMAVPSCGRIFTPADDNRDGLADGIQIRVEVQASDPAAVTLSVTDGGGAPITGSPYTAVPSGGGYAVFLNVTVVSPGLTFGTASFSASATDANGQAGTSLPSPCTVEVRDVPQVAITSPSNGALLGPANDCNASTSAFDLGVTVSTNIAAGAGMVELFVGGTTVGTQTYPGSPVTFCVPATDGAGIAVRADGTDARGTGSASVSVSIDSRPPDVAVSDLAIVIVDRRGGSLDLNWTAPSDAGGGAVAGYQIRCLTSSSGSATFDWATATSYSFTGSVAAPGAPQTQRLAGFPVERFATCMVRATDGVGSVGPLGNVPEVHLQFLTRIIPGEVGTTRFGSEIEPLGDVTGDGRADFGVGTTVGNSFYLFTGGAAVPTAWATVITGAAGSNFGYSAAGLGDFDGDTIGDFVVGAWSADVGKGRAYIFAGRTTWPATLTTADALVAFVMDDPTSTDDDSANMGWEVASAGDYDGDTLRDVLIAARGWSAFRGAALLYFGRVSPPSLVTVPGDRATGFAGDLWFPAGTTGDQFGSAVAGGVRINSDGLDDVAVSAPYGTTGGAVYVSFGRVRTTTSGLVVLGAYDQQLLSPATGVGRDFGLSLGFGLLNGDTRPDLLVTMDMPSGGASLQGAVMTFLNSGVGYPAGFSGVIQNDSSAPINDRFGRYLGTGQVGGSFAASDIDGDGRTDTLVGMYQFGTEGGRGLLFMGRDYSMTILGSSADYSSAPDVSDTTSRGAVGYLGDVNGDAHPDFAVGHTRDSADRGRIVIVY